MDEEDVAAPSVEQLQRALRLIQVGMMREARLRNWCGEYEVFAQRVNAEVGFKALGERVRRSSIDFTVNTRVRCSVNDTGQVIDEFLAYVGSFRSRLAVQFDIERVMPSVTNEVTETAADEVDTSHPGYDPNAGCNCETCMRDRAIHRPQRAADRVAPRPVPIDHIGFDPV